MKNEHSLQDRVILITGAAHRIGARTARELHDAGARLVLHYRSSAQNAEQLQAELEADRPDSVRLVKADLLKLDELHTMAEQAIAAWGRLDGLVNNASTFYPTPVGEIDQQHWDDLLGSNLKAPLFLSQAVAPELARHQGAIVNLIDIHAERPMKKHTVYCLAKAGLLMLTKSLAIELGPDVRVNAVAPGAILWPENEMPEATKEMIIGRTALKRSGDPADIARTVLFLLRDAGYISGQMIAVDGGRSLNM